MRSGRESSPPRRNAGGGRPWAGNKLIFGRAFSPARLRRASLRAARFSYDGRGLNIIVNRLRKIEYNFSPAVGRDISGAGRSGMMDQTGG